MNTYQYVNPSTNETVVATEHEYATRFKHQGFVLVNPDHVRNLRPEVQDETEQGQGKGQQPVQATRVTTEEEQEADATSRPLTGDKPTDPVAERENARRRQAKLDDVRG